MNKTEYLLICLIEECSEIQKEATKALRFGLDDKFKSVHDQADKIIIEFFDLLAVLEMLEDEGIFPDMDTEELVKNKKEKVLFWMDYSRERGTLL